MFQALSETASVRAKVLSRGRPTFTEAAVNNRKRTSDRKDIKVM